jgi:cytochrome c biogenesis protein CcdA
MSSLPLPIAAFAAGFVSFLTPCVLPLIPGYMSLISGVGLDHSMNTLGINTHNYSRVPGTVAATR